MSDINVILISSVRPAPTTAAAMTFHRLLVNQSGTHLTILPAEYAEIAPKSLWVKLIARLSRTRFARLAASADFLLHAFLPVGSQLPPPTTPKKNTLVLSLAARNGCWVAARYAKQHGLPLVVRFDDWWPDCDAVNPWLNGLLQRQFVALHRAAKVSICISAGMKSALPSHANAPIILPIPEAGKASASIPPGDIPPFRICYLGNMYDYGPMLADLARRLMSQNLMRLEFRGPEPRWPAELKQEMRAKGLLHGFASGSDFDRWFEGFHAYLVVMFFEPEQRRRVETCFATKLAEYTALGRPIVIWAPESSSVAQWARQTNGALCVTNSNPDVLIRELIALANDTQRQATLGAAARRAYESEFNPDILQRNFIEALASAFKSN